MRFEPYTRGSEKYDYEYRDRAYQKNGHHVIFIHAYKHEKQWKKYILKKIMEIEEQRHDEVTRNDRQQNNIEDKQPANCISDREKTMRIGFISNHFSIITAGKLPLIPARFHHLTPESINTANQNISFLPIHTHRTIWL